MKSVKVAWCAVAISAVLGLGTAKAAEFCISNVEGVHMTATTAGTFELFVYSKEVMAQVNNAYLYYSGQNEIAKVYYSQFLFAKASGGKACVSYATGSPAYRWVLSGVGVAEQDGWPWQ